jgi:hypothetical protein
MEIFRSVSSALIPLIKTYRTAIVFPDQNDTRIFLAYGQQLCAEGMEQHFKDDPDPKQSAKYVEYTPSITNCQLF